jgi:hypothetical protein
LKRCHGLAKLRVVAAHGSASRCTSRCSP